MVKYGLMHIKRDIFPVALDPVDNDFKNKNKKLQSFTVQIIFETEHFRLTPSEFQDHSNFCTGNNN